MSKYDNLRSNMGLSTSSGASSSSSRSEFYKKERERMASGQKSRIEEVKDLEVDNQRFAAKYTNDPRNKVETKKKVSKKKDEGFVDNLKGFLKGEKVLEGFHLRDKKEGDFDTTINKIGKVAKGEKPTETDRFIANAANSAMLGLPKELAKRSGDELTLNSYYNQRKVGEGGGKDMIAQGLGYLAPGALAVKGAKAVGLGAKAGSKGISKFGQIAKEGAVVGGAMGAAEVGIREGLNSKDQNWKENLKHVGFGVATGAVADPVIHGLGKGVSKGFESASNATMKKLLPNSQQFSDAVTSNQGDKLKFTLKRPVKTPVVPEVKQPKSIVEPKQPKPKQPFEMLRDEFESLGSNGEYVGSSPSPREAQNWGNDPENAKYLLTNERVKEDGYGIGTKYEVEEPEGDFVTVYRAVPEGADIIKPGDYVTTSKKYADNYLEKGWKLDRDHTPPVKVLEATIPKSEVTVLAANELTWTPKDSYTSTLKLALEQGKISKQQYDNLVNNRLEVEPPKAIYEQLAVAKQQEEKPRINQEPNQPSTTFKRTETIAKEPNERAMYNTFKNSTKTTGEVKERLDRMDTSYQKLSNKELVNKANELVKNDLEGAYQFVKNADRMDARHTTVAFRLIDELQATGQHDRALDLVERVAEYGTKAGQSVQALSIYNRLTPQGQLIRFQRAVNKMNQKAGVNGKKIELTEDLQKSIVATAESIQKLTGQEKLGKNVIDIVDKLKKGQAATDEETQVIKSFFEDAKKFVSDLDPKAKPQKVERIKDVRIRDKVVNIMDAQEQAARERLRKSRNRANSLPVDVFYDYTVIGASKIAKGAVKFADFSEQMIKEFGEEIKPYIQQVYNKSVERYNQQSAKMTPNKLTAAEKIVNKALKDEKISDEQAKEINDLLKQVLDATEGAKFDANLELQAALNDLQRPTFGQKVSTFQTIMMLWNPLTMERNIIGNEMFYRTDRASKLLLAAPFDKARVKIFGGKRHIVLNSGQFSWNTFFQPSKDYWKGLKMGFKAGWKGVNPFGLQTAYDIRPQTFRSKYNPMHWMEKSLGAALRGFDTAGYMRAYNGTIRELSTLKALNEGLKGKELREAAERYAREIDENMINIADEYGKYATFQDNTALANVLTTAKGWMNFGKEFGLGDLVLKFAKTPANIIVRALEYSPAGIMRSAAYLHKYYKHRNPSDIANFEMAFARAIMGTLGFSGLGYILADKGVLTTKGSSDYETSLLERQAGKQPNSVNWSAVQRFIGGGFNLNELETRKGDNFISYEWIQPIALSLAIGAGVNQSIKEEKEIDPFKATKAGVSSAFDTVINMSVLQGLKSFLTTYPGQDETDRVAGAVEGLAASFVPTLFNQARKYTDNNARETYNPEFMGNMKNKAVNRIPNLNKELPQSYDTLGLPRKLYQNDSNNIGNVFFNPSYVSQYNPTPEQEFLLDYIKRTKETEVSPRVPKKYIGDVKLNGEQWSEFKRIQGEETLKGLQNLIPRLQGETDEEKIRKHVKKTLDLAGERARMEMLKKVGE